MTKGAVLFLKGLSNETTIEDVKAFFGDYGNVAWVEYAKGDEKVSQTFLILLVLTAMHWRLAVGGAISISLQ